MEWCPRYLQGNHFEEQCSQMVWQTSRIAHNLCLWSGNQSFLSFHVYLGVETTSFFASGQQLELPCPVVFWLSCNPAVLLTTCFSPGLIYFPLFNKNTKRYMTKKSFLHWYWIMQSMASFSIWYANSHKRSNEIFDVFWPELFLRFTSHSLRSQVTLLSATTAAYLPKKSVNGSHSHDS